MELHGLFPAGMDDVTCSIDGEGLPTLVAAQDFHFQDQYHLYSVPWPTSSESDIFCRALNLSSQTQHIIQLLYRPQSQLKHTGDIIMRFDYLTYTPATNQPAEIFYVPNNHPNVSYAGMWETAAHSLQSTRTFGSNVELLFYGELDGCYVAITILV